MACCSAAVSFDGARAIVTLSICPVNLLLAGS
jgi:hypothetical protein